MLAERGMGIALLATSLAREALASGVLLPVPPGWAASRLPIHAVMSSRLQPASIRILIDFLATRLAAV